MLNAKQLFVVSTISRSDVAEALEFELDDERLTDTICQEYADGLSAVDGEDQEHDVAERIRERIS